jgi:hypothetical protein
MAAGCRVGHVCSVLAGPLRLRVGRCRETSAVRHMACTAGIAARKQAPGRLGQGRVVEGCAPGCCGKAWHTAACGSRRLLSGSMQASFHCGPCPWMCPSYRCLCPDPHCCWSVFHGHTSVLTCLGMLAAHHCPTQAHVPQPPARYPCTSCVRPAIRAPLMFYLVGMVVLSCLGWVPAGALQERAVSGSLAVMLRSC